MKRFLFLTVVLVASLTLGQDVQHAPTVAQCQADQRLWLSKIGGESSALPKYDVIMRWTSEMGDCQDVDPSNKFKYYNTQAEIIAEQQICLSHFLVRHQLWQKFIDEDAAGKR
jgi:hypothetical protein